MAQRASSSSRQSFVRTIALSLLSGVLLGLSFPPADLKWLVWVGLVPLLWAVDRCERPRRAFLLGSLAGLVFFLITLHPLVSAYTWTGWARETATQFAARMSRQWWFLHGIWIVFALSCALFWGVWAAALRRLADGRPWRLVLFAPSLWILLAEWARAQMVTFGFTCSVLGNATADLAVIRQLAAFGGVWGLSVLVVLFNVGLSQALRTREAMPWKSMPVAVLGCLVGASLLGALLLAQPLATRGAFKAAALQYDKAVYTPADFLPNGLDRGFLPLVQEALQHQARLLVLPETIAVSAVTLDGSPSHVKPPERQSSRQDWDAQMQTVLADAGAVLVVGLGTVEQSRDYNSLVAWTRDGAAGWYHKRRLVPFAEYRPRGWGLWMIRGSSPYWPGQGPQLIRVQDLVLGGLICQEVLCPWITRESVRDGATVLVSGANDGVVADPAVARIHADAAQLRAVETGRFMVRAAKTGLSAIIDPQGREMVRSRMNTSELLMGQVVPQSSTTPYVRFGDWVVWGSLLLVVWGLVRRPR